jgi:hypothetical protein
LPPSTPPDQFRVDAVETDMITVSWKAPMESNGAVTGYK